MSSGKRQYYYGEGGRQTYESESKRRMSALVELPSQCNLQDLPANDSRRPAADIELDVSVAERRIGIVRVIYLRALSR